MTSKPSFESCEKWFEELGIKYRVEREFRPKNPPRSPYPIQVFEAVFIPLTAESWCRLCMSEGDYYVGGCCGAMSHIQDLINDVFRFESGWITTEQLEKVAVCIRDHGDFGGRIPFATDKSVEDLVTEARVNWDKCDPWDRIALCWHLVKNYYAPKIPNAFGDHLSEVDKSVAILSHGLLALSWGRLLYKHPPDSQEKANRSHLLHRLLPALKTLVEGIHTLDFGTVDGFAIIEKEKGNEAIASNNYGLCIFETEEEVNHLLNLWKRQQEEYEVQERKDIDKLFDVRRVRVSLENGVEFL
ncbi:MAG: hypothetical protein HC877_24130 [Thioploca sp.]|nr:hypothetical protein [Thioploca sp.]